MRRGFDSSHSRNMTAVSIDALRGQAMNRLETIQQKLEGHGISAAFARAAKSDSFGDMGIVGSLILETLLSGTAGLMAGDMGDMSDLSRHLVVAGVIEGVALVCDQDAHKYSSRRLNDYPEGRRQAAAKAASFTKKFNLVSANQNDTLSWDIRAEMACMFEILDLLDSLEKKGVTMIGMTDHDTVYGVTKQNAKELSEARPMRHFSRPMQMAV